MRRALARVAYVKTVAARAVSGEEESPLVDDNTVGVGADAEVLRDPARPRVPAIEHRRLCPQRLAPRRLNVGVMENPLREVDVPVRAEDKAVRTAVGVGRIDPIKITNLDVRLIVPISVLEKKDVRHASHQHPSVPELEARRVVQAIGKDDALVRPAVAILIREDQQPVVERLVRMPMRVGRPRGNPEPPVRINGRLYRVHQLGELLFRREEIDGHAFGHLHPGDGLFATEIGLAAFLRSAAAPATATDVADHLDRGRDGAVVHRDLAPLRCGPDDFVAVSGHHIQHLQLVLHDGEVGLSLDKLEVGTLAIGTVAVDRAVAVEPAQVLGQDGLANGFQKLGSDLGALSEERRVDGPPQLLIAFRGQVNAVQGQGRLGLDIERPGRGEEVHKGHSGLPGHRRHCRGVELQSLVVLAAIGKIRILDIFVRDRREHHQTRGRFAVVFLLARIVDEIAQVLPEPVQPCFPCKRLVVAEECEHHVGLRVAQVRMRVAEVHGPRPHRQLVCRESEIAEHQFMLREAGLDVSLQRANVLHAVCQRVADIADAVALTQLKVCISADACRDCEKQAGDTGFQRVHRVSLGFGSVAPPGRVSFLEERWFTRCG